MRPRRLLRRPARLISNLHCLHDGVGFAADTFRDGQCFTVRFDLLCGHSAAVIVHSFEAKRDAFNQNDQAERFRHAQRAARFFARFRFFRPLLRHGLHLSGRISYGHGISYPELSRAKVQDWLTYQAIVQCFAVLA